jgi:hypothetical protein
MCRIIPGLRDFDEGPINKSNATLKLQKLNCLHPSILDSWPLDFISIGKIDAKCNKNVIIIY